MELEIVSLILGFILLTTYLLMLREVIGIKKIIKRMLRRSRKYIKTVFTNIKVWKKTSYLIKKRNGKKYKKNKRL